MASLGASLGREYQEREFKGSFDDGSFDDNFDDFLEIVPEGVEAMVPFRGSATEVLQQLVGGLRSGISYCGSLSIPEMQEKAQFIRVTGAGVKESRSHDVSEA